MSTEETSNRIGLVERSGDDRAEEKSLRKSDDCAPQRGKPEVVVVTGASAGVGRATRFISSVFAAVTVSDFLQHAAEAVKEKEK